MKDRLFKTTTLVFINIVAILVLLVLLALPLFVATGFFKFENQKKLTLGATDVLDYGSLIQVNAVTGSTQFVRIKYTAFADKSTVYENVAYVKNKSRFSQKLTILNASDETANLFFNLGRGDQPKSVEIAPDQVVLTSLVVGPVAGKNSEERESEFVIISF